MSRTFDIIRDYHEEGYAIFKKKTCTFESGVTVLVGCNGSGKSSLLEQIKGSLHRQNIPYVFHDADKDDADDKEACVTVAYVREFVPDDSGQFLVIEQLAQSRCHGYGVAALVDAGGEGVELRIVDDIDLRHIHVGRHAEVLHDVVDARILAALQRTGSCGLSHHCCVECVGDEKPYADDAQYPGQESQ